MHENGTTRKQVYHDTSFHNPDSSSWPLTSYKLGERKQKTKTRQPCKLAVPQSTAGFSVNIPAVPHFRHSMQF